MTMSEIYVLHENDEWVVPLRAQLEQLELPYREWFLDHGNFDLSESPPQGVFYNRMSASSHTRDHRYAAEYTASVLAWLEGHGRRVINTSRALQLEVSKVAQYTALHAFDIRTPRTIAAIGRDQVIEALLDWRLPDGNPVSGPQRAGAGHRPAQVIGFTIA